MSYFGEELQRQMARRDLRQVDLATASGLSQAQLSKWLNGDQISVTAEHLSMLAPALSSEVFDHASLLRAHLLDERQGPGSELVYVDIESAPLKDRPRGQSKAERALAYIASERMQNPALNDLLISMARALGAKL